MYPEPYFLDLVIPTRDMRFERLSPAQVAMIEDILALLSTKEHPGLPPLTLVHHVTLPSVDVGA